jgi:hypothetical protein
MPEKRNPSTNENVIDKENEEFIRAIREMRQEQVHKPKKQGPSCEFVLNLVDQNSDLNFEILEIDGEKTQPNSANLDKIRKDYSFRSMNLDLQLKSTKMNIFRDRVLKNDHLRPKPLRKIFQEFNKSR